MDKITQPQMREEAAHRGLIVYGTSADLEDRLRKDSKRGVFQGNLHSMSENDLREVCRSRSIPSKGNREKLVENIEKYNEYKRRHGDGWAINIGLPTPDDRLGPPTGTAILGTRSSRLYLGSYDKYIQEYQLQNGTTENALTLQYWRFLRSLP